MPEVHESSLPDASTNKRDQTIQARRGDDPQRRSTTSAKLQQKGNSASCPCPAFIGVGIVLFAIWGAFDLLPEQVGPEASDENEPRMVDAALFRMRTLSGPGIIIFAITITAAATQWVMSLEPGWASTMFPVIFAVNQFLTCFAFCLALFLLIWASQPALRERDAAEVPARHGHADAGVHAVLVVYLVLAVHAGVDRQPAGRDPVLPEAVGRAGWWYVSAVLIAFHFALPFLLLLFRDIKLHPKRLRFVAVYLLVICAVDVIWWIEPSTPHDGNFPFWLMDVGAIMGVGGVWGLCLIWQLRQRPLLPASQAFLLPEGHHHEHH